jgi:hypothetical protein
MSFVAHYAAATTHRHDEIALIFTILVIHHYYLHTQSRDIRNQCVNLYLQGRPCLPPHIHDIEEEAGSGMMRSVNSC